jgi:NADH:ubiquinone oxidoreductase subunit 4 (subunit M)
MEHKTGLPITDNINHRRITMKINVGGVDRIIRIIAGLALIGLAATGTVGVWGYIGVVPLLTGVFKFCPGYALFGLSTCPMEKK